MEKELVNRIANNSPLITLDMENMPAVELRLVWY